jgi:hypothetical protein
MSSINHELKKWVRSLTPSEKRFVNLIGKARAGSGSQSLELFEWLNKSGEGELIPAKASFRSNLPTLAVRLRELILDSLRLLHKDKDVNAGLRTSLDEIAILQNKRHYQAAGRQLRKTKKQAYEASRYTFVLQCIEAELIQAQQLPTDQAVSLLLELREEEQAVISKYKALCELWSRHDSVLALAQQFPFSRNPKIIEKLLELVDEAVIHEQLHPDLYLENALIVNTLGIRDLFLREPQIAIERYRRLLNKWKIKKEWQADQPGLLMTICKYYQNACFFSTVDPDIVHSDLLSLKSFEGLPVEELRTFRETMFHHKFILALNSGNPDIAISMIPEIEEWMKSEASCLSETQVLPFLCNFSVAEFLAENFVATNKLLTRILNLPNRKARVDIREFALVLQPVVHYELGNIRLNEYLTRSGKRHFSKNVTKRSFEMLVFNNIELLMQASEGRQKKTILQQFITELQMLNDKQFHAVPLLGLNEIYMWAVSRKNNFPLRQVFMEEVKKAHELAENREVTI